MGFRAPPVNWEQTIINLMDGYDIVYDLPGIKKDTAIAHAVQKDAIQNAMDAYDLENPDEWTVTLSLYPIKPRLVTITDTGTIGLTGNKNLDEKDLSKLTFEQYVKERWSRFEALAYANPDPRARGARGQGKFIFIGSSESKEMLYETLRDDGIYRVGHWITSKGAKPLTEPLEGNEAREYLQKHCPVLKPLQKVGTRIIIPKPKKELAIAFLPVKMCDLLKYISETWWEKLLEGWKIYINFEGADSIKIPVPSPELYRQLRDHPEKFKSRVITNAKIGFAKLKSAKVKECVIAYSEDEIPPMLQGIAIQRGGMKVASFDIRGGNEHIGDQYKKHIFGWIIFDDKTEQELRKYENTTHYGFKKVRGSIAQHILGTRGWIAREVRKFAETELGIIPEKKKKVTLEKVQSQVMNYLNQLARLYGYQRKTVTGTGKERGKGPRGPTTPIRIQMPPLVYPRFIRRVNFGERLYGTKARVVNDSKNRIVIKFGMTLSKSSRKDKIAVKPQLIARADVLEIPAGKKSSWYGKDNMMFSEEKFEPGRYILASEIVALEGEHKGNVLDRVTRPIYLERDPPPAQGIFHRMEPAVFPDATKKRKYSLNEEDGALVLYYNVEHPAYIRVDRMREIAQQVKERKIDPMFDYLLDIGLSALITEDLIDQARLVTGDKGKHFQKLMEKDIEGIRGATLTEREKLHQEFMYDIFT